MSHFKIPRYVMAINRHCMVGSMGRVGKAGDNAAMESSFSLLQKNASTAAPGPHERNCGSRSSGRHCAIEEKALVASGRHRLLGRTFLVVEVSEVQVAVHEHCEGNDA